jgi:hypothetical protein
VSDTADECTMEVDRDIFDNLFKKIPAQHRYERVTLPQPNLILPLTFGFDIYVICRTEKVTEK